MINAPCSRPRQKLKCTLTGAIFLLAASLSLPAEEKTPWRLLVEPSYMHYEAAWPIAGAETTVLAPARVIGGEIKPLTKKEVLALGVTQKQIQAEALEAASAALKKLKPVYDRDTNGVITYALLSSEDELAASTVLAPEFAEKFADTLGPDLLIAIPARNRVFVFPRQSDTFRRMGETVIAEYNSSPCSVTRELFTLRNGKLIAVGSYR